MEKSSGKKSSIPQSSTLQLVSLPLQVKSFFGYNKFKKFIQNQ
jgi:hypothetical protein